MFIPNSFKKNEMLKEIGIDSIEDLFSDIPNRLRIEKLNLPNGLSQQEVERKLREIGNKNRSFFEIPSFLGGGIKPHYIPAVVKSIASRSEFFTSYTPYQPEASQGFLQAMFEYQSLICELTGMDVANASLYDGATALGEAALMCSRITKRKTFIVPTNISPEERSVLKNYCLGAGIKIKEVPYDKETGKISLHELRKESSEDTAGICIQNPNFFGVFEDEIEEINRIAKEKDSLFVVSVDPLSLGIVKSPGDYGADIVFGEGKGLGNPLDFGGSTLGFFACKREFLRQLPGRIIGMTKDKEGRRAFCMTMQTREQHIRRGKATSNICTNEGLCALSALVYLSWLGEKGLYELGKINFERGKELFEGIISIRGFERVFTGIHFNEFVVRCKNAHKESKKLLSKGIQGGLILDYLYPELKNCMLFGVTELHSSRDIEKLLSILKEI